MKNTIWECQSNVDRISSKWCKKPFETKMLIKLDHFLQFFGFIKFKKKPFVQPQFLDVNHFPFLPFIEGETWDVSCPFFRGAKTWTAEFQAIHFDKIVLHVMAEMIKKFRKMIPSARTHPNHLSKHLERSLTCMFHLVPRNNFDIP